MADPRTPALERSPWRFRLILSGTRALRLTGYTCFTLLPSSGLSWQSTYYGSWTR